MRPTSQTEPRECLGQRGLGFQSALFWNCLPSPKISILAKKCGFDESRRKCLLELYPTTTSQDKNSAFLLHSQAIKANGSEIDLFINLRQFYYVGRPLSELKKNSKSGIPLNASI